MSQACSILFEVAQGPEGRARARLFPLGCPGLRGGQLQGEPRHKLCHTRFCWAHPWGEGSGYCLHFSEATLKDLFMHRALFSPSHSGSPSRPAVPAPSTEESWWCFPGSTLNSSCRIMQPVRLLTVAFSGFLRHGACQLHPTVREAPLQEHPCRKDRTDGREAWKGTHGRQGTGFLDGAGAQGTPHVAPRTETRLVGLCLALALLSFDCFRNKRVVCAFFFLSSSSSSSPPKLRWEANP